MKRTAPPLRHELALDRLIFLAKMGGETRERASCSGTIEVTPEGITATSVGNPEAAGTYGWPFVGLLQYRQPAKGATISVDALAAKDQRAVTVDPWGQAYVR